MFDASTEVARVRLLLFYFQTPFDPLSRLSGLNARRHRHICFPLSHLRLRLLHFSIVPIEHLHCGGGLSNTMSWVAAG